MPRTGYRKHLDLVYDLEELGIFSQMRKSFPDVQASLLGFIGKKGKNKLWNKFLRGKNGGINLKSKIDRDGKRTVKYSIGRRAKYVSISSYPLNFFEHGRRWESGIVEPGRYIITRKLSTLMDASLQGMVNEFDVKLFKKVMMAK